MHEKTLNRNFLSFSIFVLKLCLLWPNNPDYIYDNWRLLKDISLILSILPCFIPIIADFSLQLYNVADQELTAIVENLIALNCIIGMIYMIGCFVQNRRLLNTLVTKLNNFQKYKNWEAMEEVDEKANLLSKFFLFYGILGNFMYMLMPQLTVKKCQENRSAKQISDGVPCGLVVRSWFPFKFDYSPVFEMVFAHQIYTCTMVTMIVLVLTMFLCGLLMHIVHQLSNLRRFIMELKHVPNNLLLERTIYCIKYHIEIIEYSQMTTQAFSSMMLLHLTLTSLVISVLCFEILMVPTLEDSVRFTLHLLGWLVLLLLICFYGQQLIDESVSVADDIYFMQWFETPADLQKKFYMIILRSQRPLTLPAAGMGIMSFPTFLRILSSAYSFFTLLLKFKA